MSPKKDNIDVEKKNIGEKTRRGVPVVKTTIEMERSLYRRVKEEAARKQTSLKEFMSRAAFEKLDRPAFPLSEGPGDKGFITSLMDSNPFVRKVLGILRKELPDPFSITVLVTELDGFDIPPQDFSPSDLNDELIEVLVVAVDFLSGKDAALRMKEDLKDLRGM